MKNTKKITLLIVTLCLLLFIFQNCNSDASIETEDLIQDVNLNKLHPDDQEGSLLLDDSYVVPLVYVKMNITYTVGMTSAERMNIRNIFINDNQESWSIAPPGNDPNIEEWIINNNSPMPSLPCCVIVATTDGHEPLVIVDPAGNLLNILTVDTSNTSSF